MATHALAARHRFYRLTEEDRNTGISKIKDQIKNYQLNTSEPSIQIIGQNKNTTSTAVGTDRACQDSIIRYETSWRAALDFCIEISDFDSAMIFAREICPADPLPMSVETSISCLRFHVQEEGTILKHHKTDQPFISALTGEPLVCLGDWRSTETISSYCSALVKVHVHYTTTSGTYCEACDDCAMIPMKELQDGKGCRRHLGSPHFWRSGVQPLHLTSRIIEG